MEPKIGKNSMRPAMNLPTTSGERFADFWARVERERDALCNHCWCSSKRLGYWITWTCCKCGVEVHG